MATIVKVKEVDIDSIKLRRSTLVSQGDEKSVAVVEFYAVENSTRIRIWSELCEVAGLTLYEFNDRPVAYQVALIPTSISHTGVRQNQPIAYDLIYSDQDGDGNFETRENGGAVRLPAWVKDRSRAPK